ncbi:hypothetical protein H8E88_11090 [candidate division KSB1 bacterium]|nr:hypothetical protein [candidate division KSB1 bacterium]MBL7092998.1 hypothetical protein [candidate division KSB1 bacterium]
MKLILKKILIILTIIFIVCLNCLNPFAPKLVDSNNEDLIITEQKTPDQVLDNFKYSYVFKDSVLYSELLDSSFVFIYFDPNIESSGRFVSWGRDIDLKTTGRLFRNYDVIDLIWNSTIYSFNEEDRAEYSKSFHLSLIKDNETVNISGNAIFIFKKSEYDKKWRIIQWKDESDL